MRARIISQITKGLQNLSTDKLVVVHDFVSHLLKGEMAERDLENKPEGRDEQAVKIVPKFGDKGVTINQGDVYWVALAVPGGLAVNIAHPYVVVQDNVFNHSRIDSVIVCALTSNQKRASIPGNVLLEVGEANLPKLSVVEVSKVSTVDKKQLGEYIGSLDERRVRQVLAGIQFLQTSFFRNS